MSIINSDEKVSIFLATYNGEKYLRSQIDSLLAQVFSSFDIWIHDDCSSDETVTIIREYVQRHPGKVYYLDDGISFGSASANFNFILQSVKSHYVMFCDQDDIWKKDKISVTYNKMKSTEANHPQLPVLVHSDLEVVNHKLQCIAESFWQYQHIAAGKNKVNQLLLQNTITGCTVMVNRQLIELAIPIPDSAIMHDWWLALVASEFGCIARINTATMLYRQHKRNDTGAVQYSFNYIYIKIKSLRDKTLQLNQNQANIFLQRYENILSPKSIDILRAFINLTSFSWVMRRYVLLKYGILKFGLARNIGLLLKI